MAPAVTVVIPALDAAATLGEQLAALARQSIEASWEIVLVDNGSKDETAAVAAGSPTHPACVVRVVSEPKRGLNIARNAGVRAAAAPIVAICDADDVVDDRWLVEMLAGLNDVDIVVGMLDVISLNTTEAAELRGWSGLAGPTPALNEDLGFLPQTLCGNVAFSKHVWVAVGGFDEQMSRGGDDVDFGWRAQLAGHTVGSAPAAVLHYRARDDRRSLFRQYVRDGEGSAHLYARYRDRGMPRRSLTAGLRTVLWVCRRLPLLHRRDLAAQGHVLRTAAKQLGRLRGSLRHRVVYP